MSATSPALLDHFVGARKHGWWHGDTKRLSGLEIDDQAKFRRLLNRQIAWFGAFENLVHVDRGALVHILVAVRARAGPQTGTGLRWS
jgi:hypothetical protein